LIGEETKSRLNSGNACFHAFPKLLSSSLLSTKVNIKIYKIIILFVAFRNRDSSVGIATGYGLDNRRVGVRVPVGSRIFCPPRRPDRLWGSTQPPIQWVPGVKRQGREADHSPPTSAEVKKMWIYASTPPYAFMA
jgi:hypothetical protein